jgi:hypothetical protein
VLDNSLAQQYFILSIKRAFILSLWELPQGKRTTIKIKELQLKCHIMSIL